jgi:hypothetical protein
MSTGFFQSIHTMAELENPEQAIIHGEFSSEQPTVADLVLPGTGSKFSDEFACLLDVLSGAKRGSL